MKKFIKISVTAICVFVIILLVIKPEIYVDSAKQGIILWALTVLPSLLPFFFLTKILTDLKIAERFSFLLEKPFRKIFRTGGITSYAFIMSLLSGYPVGAKIIAEFSERGIMTSAEATRASTLCSTSGPLFIIGSVGYGMFGNKNCGYIIIISHILSAVFCGILFRFYGKDAKTQKFSTAKLKNTNSNELYNAVYSSVISVAVVGGFICVFYLFSDVALNTGILKPVTAFFNIFIKDFNVSNAFSSGIIECTKGAKALSACGISKLSVSLTASLISFGGISVIFQSLAFLSSAKTNTLIFFISKIMQAVFSFFICSLLYGVFF